MSFFLMNWNMKPPPTRSAKTAIAPIKPVLAAAAALSVLEVGLEDGISLGNNDGALEGLKDGE